MNQLFICLSLLFVFFSCKPESKNSLEYDTDILAIKKQGLMCSTPVTDIEWYMKNSKAPLIEGLEVIDYPITTTNPEAQKYFNQGLVLAYGFNHAEAARSFYESMRQDSTCAMCYWGFAYVLGPNYNAGMEPDNFERAYEAIQKAVKLSESTTIKEQDLISAMAMRYTQNPPEDRDHLDMAYSRALANLTQKYPTDEEVSVLFAESLMNLHPWDLYSKDGVPRPWTAGILETLNRTLTLNPRHPGAHHFYIHAVEASNQPERGYTSAKIFDDDLVPGAGHLVHMPSHIYIRTGDYHKGTLSNIRAVRVDSSYITQCHAQGAYPLAYFPHNIHFLSATAALSGNSYWAIKSANSVSEYASREIMKEPGWGTLQHYYTIPYYMAIKFAKWDDILKMENFDSTLKYPEAVRHYARGMAYWGIGDLAEARTALSNLEKLADDPYLKKVTIWNINTVADLLQIARRVLEGEIIAAEGNYNRAIRILKEAAALEDQLNYDEPPDWFFSVRHHLGAVLLDAKRYEDALEVYRDDLKRLPKNGWAYHGMKKAYTQLGSTEDVKGIEILIGEAWSVADIHLETSRLK